MRQKIRQEIEYNICVSFYKDQKGHFKDLVKIIFFNFSYKKIVKLYINDTNSNLSYIDNC